MKWISWTPKSGVALLALFIFSINSFADMSAFNKRFNIVRENGKVVTIKDNSLNFTFSIRPYLEFIKESLKREQALLNSKSDYDYELYELLSNGQKNLSEKENQNIETIITSMRAFQDMDFDAIFADEKFNQVVSQFELKLSDALELLDPTIVAKLDDPTFFYKRAVGYQVVKWGLDLAKKLLSSVPVLNTASYVVVQVEKMIREKRDYHQNMLLHYFEMVEASEIGMTDAEVDMAYSSIYESKIPWFMKWESNTAQRSWSKYGVNKFFANFRMGTNRMRNFKREYTNLGERLNFAFQEVEYQGEKVIINLFDQDNMLNGMPAISHSYDNPQKIVRKRVVLQLAGLGLSFVSLPNFIKDMADSYIKSHYEKQQITEGSLYAHFEYNQDEQMTKALATQFVNPFENSL